MGGHVWVGTIINTTAADWTTVNGTSKEEEGEGGVGGGGERESVGSVGACRCVMLCM